MTNNQIRAKALRILSKDKPTKGELSWWLEILVELELSNLSWQKNLDVDVPLKSRCVSGNFKLSKTEMYSVRSMYVSGNITQDEIAKEFGVTRSTIFFVLYPEKRKVRKDLAVTI
jgi:DNA-binding XRE family transcriptional regulator|tara:strand:+ start:5783 stop:6127 length:345 start_codon:yes stop_codon:yes gene_type:complete